MKVSWGLDVVTLPFHQSALEYRWMGLRTIFVSTDLRLRQWLLCHYKINQLSYQYSSPVQGESPCVRDSLICSWATWLKWRSFTIWRSVSWIVVVCMPRLQLSCSQSTSPQLKFPPFIVMMLGVVPTILVTTDFMKDELVSVTIGLAIEDRQTKFTFLL